MKWLLITSTISQGRHALSKRNHGGRNRNGSVSTRTNTKIGGDNMKTYNAHQFLNTREPYEYLYKMKNDPLRHEQALTAMKENAHAVGVKNFNRMYANYVRSQQSDRGNI